MRYLIFISFLLISFNTFASGKHDHDHDHEKKSVNKEKHDHDNKATLDAHLHGLGTMNIVQDHNKILVELEMPGFDIVGFEYKAKTSVDKNKVNAALKILENPANVINFTNAGNCDLKKTKSIILEEKNHTEFRAEYSFLCSNISKVKSLKINVFDKFKNSEKIELNVVGEHSTENIILSRSNKIINLNSFSH